MGDIYEQGNGVKKNYSKAIKLYKEAINLGNCDAMANFGDMYLEGKGVKQDEDNTIEMHQECIENAALSVLLYGIALYLEEIEDFVNAKKYLKRAIAVDGGGLTGLALKKLATYYVDNGKNTPEDLCRAKEYYQEAMEYCEDCTAELEIIESRLKI